MASEYDGLPNGNDGDGQSPTAVHFADTPLTTAPTNVDESSTIPVPFRPISPTNPPSFQTTTSTSDTASIRTTLHIEEARSPFTTLNLSPVSSLTTRIQASKTEKILGPSSGDGYFATQSHLHPNSKNHSLSSASNPLSHQTSSSSLQSLSEDAVAMGNFQSLGRTRSLRSTPGHARGRRISHSKSSSTAPPAPPRMAGSGFDHPVYPEQSFSALQSQVHSTRPPPFLRTRSSHPSQNSLYSGMSTSPAQSRDRTSPSQGTRTAGNTPISSPGLFSMRASRSTPPGSHGNDVSRSDSPHLHPTHLQTPKETHAAEIDYDMFTGNKFINSYEVLEEIGRGENGKVKLARDVENNTIVAVKIVPRYSKRRRLGKLGAPEDRVKKEVAILKKARHPNVVSLLEVIDDPSRHKVYIVLEYVEQGEIVWRKKGLREIVAVNRRRLDREKRAIPETTDTWEQDMFMVSRAQRHREHLQERLKYAGEGPLPWSLEHGDEPEDDDLAEMSRALSRQPKRLFDPSRNEFYEYDESPPDRALEGSMYGPYSSEIYSNRKMSIAASSVSQMSSEASWNDDDDPSAYVPTLTLSQAREAFRDTVLGLEFLHFQGIIHRDIKPANLLVASDGHIKISDFGVSYLGKPLKENEEDKTSESDSIALDDPRELARTVGTPAFYAPELVYDDPRQFEGGEDGSGPKITGSLDLWSLGVTLYAMLYGFLPFYEDSHSHEGLFQKIVKSEVFLPKTRLLPVEPSSSSKTDSQVRMDQVTSSNKRLDHEFKVEEVSESARDLIRCLLIKDPARRITIEKIKRHPWVVEGIANPSQWIGETNPAKDGKSKIVVDERDVSHAVVKRSLVERALSGVSRIAGSFLGRREGRKRATSTTTSASASAESVVSASVSSDSTIGRERKAKDPRGEEVVAALKASRDGEHPLAQSQTASPEDDRTASYFRDLLLDMKASTTNCTPLTEEERRPRGPERAASSLSTADSTRTVRASQSTIRPPLHESLQQELESSNMEAMADRLGGLFSGSRKNLTAPKSQERRPSGGDRALSSNRSSGDSNPHSSPSVAISRTAASGDIETPEALQTEPPALEKSLLSPTPHDPSQGWKNTFHQPPESSAAAFEHAQDMNQRRQILEAEIEAERVASRRENTSSEHDCPPSPDDEMYLRNIKTVFPHGTSSTAIQNLPSASTIASSSIDDLNSSMSQSMSQPSIPSTVSGASSLSAENYLPPVKPAGFAPSKGSTNEEVGYFMSTGETITVHGVPVIMPGRSIEEQQASSNGNGVDDEDNDGDGDNDVDDDDDSDEGLTFGGPSRRRNM